MEGIGDALDTYKKEWKHLDNIYDFTFPGDVTTTDSMDYMQSQLLRLGYSDTTIITSIPILYLVIYLYII